MSPDTMGSSHSIRSSLALIAASVLVTACAPSRSPSDSTVDAEQEMESLVTAVWLSEHLDDPDLVLLDCTVLVQADEKGGFQIVSGRANYDAGHIPTAGFADLLVDLSDPDSSLEFVMPSAERFAAAMGALGVGKDSRVVLYSANNPDWPARVWWMLRWAGFDNVALLDGGLATWIAEGHPLSTESAKHPARQFTAALRPEMIADRDQVLAATENGGISLIDALPDAHFRGGFSMYDRPGHILGAMNMPSSDLLDETGRFRAYDELEWVYDGDDRNNRVITYCGGGVAASSVAFTMHRLGFTDVAVYMGSLQEWAADPANPMSLD